MAPLWYNEPLDKQAQAVSDEFMLGTDDCPQKTDV